MRFCLGNMLTKRTRTRSIGLNGTYSGGNEKSAEILGKSVAMFAGFSEGPSRDRDLRYSFSPDSTLSRNSPKALGL